MPSIPTEATLDPCHGPQASAIYFKLSPDSIAAILAAGGKGIKLAFGERLELEIGASRFPTTSIEEASHVDVYRGSGKRYANVGRVTHRLTVQRPSQMTAAQLKTQNKSLQRQKDAKKAVLLNENESKAAAEKTTRLKQRSAQTPPLTGGHHSHARATSDIKSLPNSPLLGNRSPKPRATLPLHKPLASLSLTAGPIRALHLLALGPNTVPTVAARTNLSQGDIEAIFAEYATKRPDGKWVVADSTYKDLRVWDWKYYTSSERQQVIRDSRAAFDRLKYPADHPARLNLDNAPAKSRSRPTGSVSPTATTSPTTTTKPASTTTTTTTTTSSSSSSSSITTAASNTAASHNSTTNYSTLSGAAASEHTTPRSLATPGSSSSSSSLKRPNGGTTTKPPSKRPRTEEESGNGPAATTSGAKRSTPAASSSAQSTKRPSSVDQDLFELAQRFRKTYSEYARLYQHLSAEQKNRKTKAAEVQRLLTMHRELESWKKKIWDMTPSR
ncbi:hypothetical protein TRVA0_022S00408 [Trichomonascus vanleenenianus]|uniref:uncharacterized protein n=1 Tax=Trichomonascus vanleenenianus TaxID=2268995 RepID=UPI003EC9C174